MGTNWPQIGLLCFAVGDIIKSCAQSKFEAQRLKIAIFRTDRTFWDAKLPHLLKKKIKFAHCHILEIIMQQKAAKFHGY